MNWWVCVHFEICRNFGPINCSHVASFFSKIFFSVTHHQITWHNQILKLLLFLCVCGFFFQILFAQLWYQHESEKYNCSDACCVHMYAFYFSLCVQVCVFCLCEWVCVCVCTCIHVCVCVRAYTCVFCMCVHACTCTCVCLFLKCMFTFVFVCLSVF